MISNFERQQITLKILFIHILGLFIIMEGKVEGFALDTGMIGMIGIMRKQLKVLNYSAFLRI